MAMGNSHPNMVDPDGGLAGWEGIPTEATGKFSVMKFAQVVASLGSIQISGDAQNLNKVVGNISSHINQKAHDFNNMRSVSTPTDPVTKFCKNVFNKIASKATGSNHYQRKAFWNKVKKKLNKIHFSIGMRLGKFIMYDIKFNQQDDGPNERDFPGRSWGFKGKRWRLSLFYIDWAAIRRKAPTF